MRTIERTDHLYTLDCEAIDADQFGCSECHDTAPGNKLLVYYSVRGGRRRKHGGAFCSKVCHDWFHGLKMRR